MVEGGTKGAEESFGESAEKRVASEALEAVEEALEEPAVCSAEDAVD